MASSGRGHLRVPPLIIPAIKTDTCMFCEERFGPDGEYPCILSCGHVFGSECIRRWLQRRNKTCPNCRQDPYKPTLTHATTHIPDDPFLLKDSFSPFGSFTQSLKRSLTEIAEFEIHIEQFSTSNPIEAVRAMAACWLLRKSPQENATNLAAHYTTTMKDAYNATRQALESSLTKAVANGFPVNPYIALLSEIPRLIPNVAEDHENPWKQLKMFTIIQIAAMQSLKIESDLSDRIKLAEIIIREATSGDSHGHNTETDQNLKLTREAFQGLVVLSNEKSRQNVPAELATRRFAAEMLEKAYLNAVVSSKPWGPKTPDFVIQLISKEPSTSFSVNSNPNMPLSALPIQNPARHKVQNITTRDMRFTPLNYHMSMAQGMSPSVNMTPASYNRPFAQPSGGFLGSNSNVSGTNLNGPALFGGSTNSISSGQRPLPTFFSSQMTGQAQLQNHSQASSDNFRPSPQVFSTWPFGADQSAPCNPTTLQGSFNMSPHTSSNPTGTCGTFDTIQPSSQFQSSGVFCGMPSTNRRLFGSHNSNNASQAPTTSLFGTASSSGGLFQSNSAGAESQTPIYGGLGLGSSSNPPSHGIFGAQTSTGAGRAQSETTSGGVISPTSRTPLFDNMMRLNGQQNRDLRD